jgi:adenylate cyclase
MADKQRNIGKKSASGLAPSLTRALRQIGSLRLIFTMLLLVVAVFIARFSWQIPLAIQAERAFFDLQVGTMAPRRDQDNRIVQIVYNDETLAATGKRSPLDRAILAKALKRIDSFKPKAIGIDILIDQAQPEDPIIIEAFRSVKTPTWIAYASADVAESKIMLWQQEFIETFQKSLPPGNIMLGNIILEPDDDNVLRTWPTVHKGQPERLFSALLPLGKKAPFKNFQGSIQYVSPEFVERPVFSSIPIDTLAEDALFESPEAEALFRQQIEGKYVLIGGHIQDIDLFETSLGGKPIWGVEIFAHLLSQQLDGRILSPVPNWLIWVSAIVAVLAAAISASLNIRASLIAVIIIVQLGTMVALPFYLQSVLIDTYLLPSVGWMLGWLLSFTVVGAAARAIGAEQRQFAQGALGKFLPPAIASEILRNPDSLTLHGEKREIFVVFTDLEGFTKLSHAIEPEMVAMLLNRYLDMLSSVVLEYGGTIDKFIGDAIVAFWGAPISRPDDGERAAKAAWALYEAGEEFRKTVPDGVPKIGVTRVGLHFGEAIVGNFGGEGRFQYTALGDSMNTAARLEAANKQTKSKVLASQEAVELAGVDWFRPLGRVVLRGRATPLEVFEPVPKMDKVERQRFAYLAEKAIRGDVSAITALNDDSASHPEDIALANFVYRLAHQEKGGYFVLD